jgi:3-dehydroquinate synthase
MTNKIRIGVCLKAQDDPFWTHDVRKGFDNASHELKNVQTIIKIAQRITNISEQQKILNEFISKKYDLIILAPSDSIKLIPSIKKINDANIPLIIIDSKIDEERAKEKNLKFHSITFDNYKGGYETGKLLLEKLSKNDEVAIIEGIKIGSYTKRVDGFKDAVKGKLNVVQVESADFEENKAYKKTKQLIKKHSQIKAIFSTNDSMAFGAYTALKEENRDDILLCAFNLTYAGNIALNQNKFLSSIDVSPEKMGDYALDFALKILKGEELDEDFVYDVKLVTKENITSLPKEAVVKRKYKIVEAKPNLNEFAYDNLRDITTCPIIIGNNMFEELLPRIKKLNADKHIIITDSTLISLYANKLKKSFINNNLEVNLFSINAGEKNKTFNTLNYMANEVLDSKISKRSVIILLGGGVVGNLGGFLAAILMRGVRFVHVPTTIMHQVDASTGGKQAINTRHGKNILGTFYEPEFIYNDISCIKTLPIKEYKSGIAEVIKHGFCESKDLIELALNKDYKKVLIETLKLKIQIMESDPRELNEGFILIYGHTLGHAIEILSDGKLTHGEAISIGMVLASKISYEMKFAKEELVNYHIDTLKKFNLPTRIPSDIDKNEIINRLSYDKKERRKDITFCLLEDIGKVKKMNNSYSIPVPLNIIKKVISDD